MRVSVDTLTRQLQYHWFQEQCVGGELMGRSQIVTEEWPPRESVSQPMTWHPPQPHQQLGSPSQSSSGNTRV